MDAHRPVRHSTTRMVAVVGVAVVILLVLSSLPATRPGGAASSGNSGLQTFKKAFTPSGALHIPNAGPVVNLVKGDRVNVTYEYEALGYNSTLYGLLLRIPTAFAVFTQPSGNLVYIPVLDRNVTLTRSGFNNGTATQSTETMVSNFTLDPAVVPFLSTLKLALMANTSYGTFQLAIRWDYTIWIQANDTTLASNWSAFGNGGGQESTVWPAQLVSVVKTTPEYATVGSLFTAELSGLVSGQAYWVEVEDPFTGITTENVWDNATVGAKTFNVSILLQSGKGLMAAAPWLVHIHDSYKQILFSIPVYLSDPTNATIYFKTSPTTCSPVTFNGHSQSMGSKIANLPANVSYSLKAGSCSGYTFASWSSIGGGGVFANDMRAATSVRLVYNTTVIGTYVPDFPPL